MPRLCRSRAGTIHRTDCPQATRPRVVLFAWYWAEGKTVDEILSQPWNRPCKYCDPLADWEAA